MNPERVAELHRELAALHLELADAYADEPTEAAPHGASPTPPPPPPAPRAPRRRGRRTVRVPPNVSDIDVAKARKMLKDRGLLRP